MGGFISRWRKKKLTTVETLEKLDKEIKDLEQCKQTNMEQQKRWAILLIVYSGLLYVIFAVVFYVSYRPVELRHKIIYSLPLLVFPLIVWAIRKFLHWYFIKRIRKNDTALEELTEEKTKLLDEIMETETYKKAKEILEKFAPERMSNTMVQGMPLTPVQETDRQNQDLRKRAVSGLVEGEPVTPNLRADGSKVPQNPSQSPGRAAPPGPYRQGPQPQQPGRQQPVPGGVGRGQPQQGKIPQQQAQQGQPLAQQGQQQTYRRYNPATPPGPPMPRTVLPRERSVMDKLVEYFVGDGPQNRYALVCKRCLSHNGMALREEFEFLAFRCCYCYAMNPARKQKPRAPALPIIDLDEPSQTNSRNVKTSNESPNRADCKTIIDVKASNSESERLVAAVGGAHAAVTDDHSNDTDEDQSSPSESSSESKLAVSAESKNRQRENSAESHDTGLMEVDEHQELSAENSLADIIETTSMETSPR